MASSSRPRLAFGAVAMFILLTGASRGGLRPVTSPVAAQSADLSIVNSDSSDPVSAGDALVYTLTVINAGPDAAITIAVTVALPSGLAGITASGIGWTCLDPVAGILTCTRERLDVGAAPAILVMGTVPGGGPLNSRMRVSSATFDPVVSNNTEEEDTVVMPAG